MPPVSQSQRRAMWAAAAGHSNIGIPQSVGKEFAESDPGGKLPQRVHKRADGGSLDDRVIEAATHLARTPRRQMGGGLSPSMAAPWWERAEARSEERSPYGFSLGTGAGRNDKNNVNLMAESYVLPADVIAGLGEGNSLHGAAVWDSIIKSMPYGTAGPPRDRGRGPPQPPHGGLPQGKEPLTPTLASGGKAKEENDTEEETVPVITADGEILVHPDHVEMIGRHFLGNRGATASHDAAMKHGHEVLDEFVKEVLGREIGRLQKLKGPHGSKNASIGHNKDAIARAA